MDKKKEEFLAQLRKTFEGEASEHLEVIRAGLIAMEHAEEGEQASIIERVFRESHSLKGAARSVALADTEALCAELERVFAAMKSAELKTTPDILETIHETLSVLSILCRNPGAPLTSGEEGRRRSVLQVMKGILPDGLQASPDAAVPASADHPARQVFPDTIAEDSVRVTMKKLGDILIEAEELISARNGANDRAANLLAIAEDLSGWNRRNAQQAVRLRRIGAVPSVSGFIDFGDHFAQTLEDSLRKTAVAAQQDAFVLATVTDRLLDRVRMLVLLPCSYLFSPLPMVAHDLAWDQGKDANLRIQGEDIEIDRRILDELKDPFNHLLRNCIDHGIEKPAARRALGKPDYGSITIMARTTEGNRVELTVSDDGAGIDCGKIKDTAVRRGYISIAEAEAMDDDAARELIFRSGFSMSTVITDLSGRGLGLTIVREKVEKLGGTISVSSVPGKGTTFRILVPSSLATFRGVSVGVTGHNFVIPTESVECVGRVKPDEIRTIENRHTVTVDGSAVSLAWMRDILELTGPDMRENNAVFPFILVRSAARRMAFIVDEICDEREVLVKKLQRRLIPVRNIAGTAIANDGSVVLILNVGDLIESASAAGACVRPADTIIDEKTQERRKRLLVAEDSITARTLIKNILDGAGYDVTTAVDGMDALTKVKSNPFDLVVSDVDMPRMNGFELTSRIRADKNLDALPVVLVTALDSQKDREYGIEVGANAYIVKSDFDQGNLLEIIKRLL